MEFGKLKDISSVDFSLPPDAPGTMEALEKSSASSDGLNWYTGCTGWAMKEWVGTVYPSGTKSQDFLREYALQFNTIELNTTHYRIPNHATIAKWRKSVPADFRFCPKIPQTISHSRHLGVGSDQIYLFAEAIQQMEEQLGCCFIQLPPLFGPDQLPILERFLDFWPNHLPLAVELRHPAWFEKNDRGLKVFEIMEKRQIFPVLTDVAGRRDVLHMRLTGNTVLIRFVGNGLHPTDYTRIDAWMERLLGWHESGLSAVYFFTHEPDNLLAPELAAYLSGKLSQLSTILTRGPRLIRDSRNGAQMSLF